MKFLIDEDLPLSLADALTAAGHSVEDVRRIGLRGATDSQVLNHAAKSGAILLTADIDFAGHLAQSHTAIEGCVLVRMPNEISTTDLCRVVVSAIESLPREARLNHLIVIEADRIRLRRLPSEN